LLRILCRHIHAQTLTHRISKGCIIATKYGFKSDYLVSTAADNDNCLFRQGYQDGRAGMVGQQDVVVGVWEQAFAWDVFARLLERRVPSKLVYTVSSVL
jgi:hypothetical protein